MTDHDQMRAVAAEVSEHFGRVDVVVANAGRGRPAPPPPWARMGAREVGRLAPELMATAAARRRPLGPGGLAALASPAEHP